MGGDIYSDGVRTYTRDEFDRLAMVSKSGQTVGQYRYDALDRRVYKGTGLGAIYFVYAPSGQLLYEQSSQRTLDYVWLAGRLVGISVNHGALQTVHTDWLGRPELVTGVTSPTVSWRASNAVFDRKVTLDTIGGLNIFFPGQYYDSETDLYYNWHRYYDASSGRYVQSDPIGLSGGINTYAYAKSAPLSFIDPSGLSYAAYNTSENTISIYNGQGNILGTYAAGNNTVNGSAGPFANGTYPFSHYNPHTSQANPNSAFGSNGIFVVDRPGCSGCGVHSGRADRGGPAHKTEGCIRTTDDATELLKELGASGDPFTGVSVGPSTPIGVIPSVFGPSQ